MTKPLAEQFDLEDELVDFGLERGQARKFMSMLKLLLRTAETEIRADAEKQANDHLKAIIGMERDMAKAEERARVVEWASQRLVNQSMSGKLGWNGALDSLLSFLAKENK